MKQEINNEYLNNLKQIKETIAENRNKAMVIVNSAMIITYYRIGQIINKRKTWGNKYIERLASELKNYGTGFSVEQLKRMSKFATIFTQDEIVSQPVAQIPWGTLVSIMFKASSKEEMLWYINQTHKKRWSRRIVLEQFEKQAYERNVVVPQTSDDEDNA